MSACSAVLFTALLAACSAHAYAIEEAIPCEQDRSLRLWDANDRDGRQERRAAWSTVVTAKRIRASCYFSEGHRIRLGDLAWWRDPATAEKGVWVFRGIGNHCSQNQLLVYNEKTGIVLILNVIDMKSSEYQCRGK